MEIRNGDQLRVLMAFSRYRNRGGEDEAFERDVRLLQDLGIEVHVLNPEPPETPDVLAKAMAAGNLVWSKSAARSVTDVIRKFRPHLMHVHNTFPSLSASSVFAASREEVPVVHTLHNYRYFCAAATAYRDGETCTDCLGRIVPWPAAKHGCYHDDFLSSAVVGVHVAANRPIWDRHIDAYVLLTDFQRELLVKAGLDDARTHVRPNFMDDPGRNEYTSDDYCLYVGRLSEEKGFDLLLAAMAGTRHARLRVIGEGPLVQMAERSGNNVSYLGRRQHSFVLESMRRSRFVVLPSVCFEVMPLVLLEAMAVSRPAIVNDRGALPGLVGYGRSGAVVRDPTPATWARAIDDLWRNQERRDQMGAAARSRFEDRHTRDAAARSLMSIYEAATHHRFPASSAARAWRTVQA